MCMLCDRVVRLGNHGALEPGMTFGMDLPSLASSQLLGA